MEIDVFRKEIAESSQTLHLMSLNSKLSVGISDPTPLKKLLFKKSTTQYFDKEAPQQIITIEDEYIASPLRLAAKKIFPPIWHYQPKDVQKIQTFYECILIDTDSIAIKYYKDKNNPNIIIHSTV